MKLLALVVLLLGFFQVCSFEDFSEVNVLLRHDGDYHTLYKQIPRISVVRPIVGSDVVEVNLLRNDLLLLNNFNYSYEIIPEETEFLEETNFRRQEPPHTSLTWNRHHNYDSMTKYMAYFSENYPSFTSLFSIGQSVRGREIWCLKIAENAEENPKDKPELHYVGNIHGDEVVSRELLLRFIDLLLTTYLSGKEAQNNGDTLTEVETRVVRLIESTQIYIIPSMNPDGYESHSRRNANGVDMNRNFPDQFHGDSPHREPEVAAMMNWTLYHNFILSISFHGGDCVVSYPFDGTENGRTENSPSPDVEVIEYIAKKYATTNPGMMSNRHFRKGVTNGAAWYPLYGGMADWKYLEGHGVIEMTVELSKKKWPTPSSLAGYWDDNRVSMLTYLENVFTGIWGRISLDDEPCPNGKVLVDGISFHMPANDEGYFYRVLAPGDYKVSFSCHGRISDPFDVTVIDLEPVWMEVPL